MKINQIYHPYTLWEDYHAGFYGYDFNDFDYKFNMSIQLLSDSDMFYKVAKHMVSEWIYSCEQNLTDSSMNKIAYIGQASCCFNHGAPAELTRQAWWHIPKEKRDMADETAQRVINEWEKEMIMKGSLWEKTI